MGTRRWAKSPIGDEQVLLHLSHGQTVPVVLQTDNHASTPPQAGCPSCRQTNSVKALKAQSYT